MNLLFENYDKGCSPFIEHSLSGISRDIRNCADRFRTILHMTASSALHGISESELQDSGENQLLCLLKDLAEAFDEMRRQMCGNGASEEPPLKGCYRKAVSSVLLERRRIGEKNEDW